jgi:pimeloyl-ACP methyl ester carboxylesterase
VNRETHHSFASIDGARLHWAELGEADHATPVVLLHGLNDSYLTWRRAAPGLAMDRRVLLPDLLGHGLSERPDASYELGWHAKVIAKWLETLNLENVDVVGHSFGGGVAQMLLLECHPLIRRIVLVAPGGLGRGVTPALRLASLPHAVELMGQPFMAFGTRMALRGKRDGFSKQDIAELSKMNAQPGSARAFARTVRDVIDWRGQRRTFLDRVHEVKTFPPTALCWGDRDKIISIAQGRAFVRFVEGSLLREFPGCGHYLHNQEPVKFAHIVRDFLDDPSPRIPRLARSDVNEADYARAVRVAGSQPV